jgi:hypothetical protein
MAMALSGGTACGWEQPSGCAYWVGKLRRGEEAQIAMARAAAAGCVDARPLLLERLDDPTLGGDALAALIALGPSEQAETALRRSLAVVARVAVAAEQVQQWKLAAATPELAAALADRALVAHRHELLQAALTVAPPDQLVGALRAVATTPSEAAPVRRAALEALARADWTKAGDDSARAAAALAELAVDPDLGDLAVTALARLPVAAGAGADGLLEAARGGDRRALVLASALDPEAGRAAAVSALTEGPKAAWGAAAPLAVGADLAKFDAALGAQQQDPERLWQIVMVVGAPARERVADMAANGKGDTRAAAIRGQALLLGGAELAAWRDEASKHASVLVREVVSRPDVTAVTALSEACGRDSACLSKDITDTAPKLASVDAELAVARQAHEVARAAAESAVAADRERAQALAELPAGEAADAAKAELEGLRARRDEAYKAVEAAATEVDSREALLTRAMVALGRLSAVGGAGAVPAALSVLSQARGESTATLRLWALAVLAAQAGAADSAAVAAAGERTTDDASLAFALSRLAGRLATKR